eukprot:CAMPEP_0202923674 /NCGR_PEP_ID=MMETSP1392-20130828/78575_1 /ASSEMBLY_ACC=CAM_ASM_000868 /TAXON_ID=225041 /ORGANISM="Chlamydomonas chlamydogama, Strain SAG 11-48b" /LENGTH=79 /DNA_ID=CAMNT_0049617369 /DNA_START=603 /DNA_END=842 /DNA_ORIENTATION=-
MARSKLLGSASAFTLAQVQAGRKAAASSILDDHSPYTAGILADDMLSLTDAGYYWALLSKPCTPKAGDGGDMSIDSIHT